MMGRHLRNPGSPPTSFAKLYQVQDKWNNVIQGGVHHLCNRMYARVQVCVNAPRGYTVY